jgi:ubiquinone/menaquinone biosynthesis C-methylase UbiE
MLKLAAVQKADTVYDLGSGDGRIVIAAAKEFGARGVGIDINPERVARAQVKAEKAGVANRTKFAVGDLFNADIHEATVVTLYLLPDVNARVRSKLLSELKPGTRIVSHEFGIKDWPADKEVVVNGSKIFLWTVPDKKLSANRTCTACAPGADLLR